MKEGERMKERLLTFFNEKDAKPLSVDEIEEQMAIEGAEDFKELVKALNQLEESGELVRTRKNRYGLPEKMNLVLGKIQMHKKGFAFLLPEEEGLEDIYINPSDLNSAMNGDKVLVRREKPTSSNGRAEGVVLRILERSVVEVVGTYDDNRNFGFVIPDDKRIPHDIFIPKDKANGAVDGHKVIARITKYPEAWSSAEAEVTKILGHKNDPGIDIISIIYKHGITIDFPEEVLDQAANAPDTIAPEELEGRKDLRDEVIVTIDGADAKDLDDAISVKKLDNGNYELGVYIADVSYYVEQDSPMDKEAFERGNSVYLVDRVIPMIPHRLSNGICSLNPKVDRLTIGCEMEINASGEVVKHEIFPSVINSTERMTYTDVNKILVDKDEELREKYAPLVPMFESMEKLAAILRKKRQGRGAIDFDFKEAQVLVDEDGKAVDVVIRERSVGERLIEEFMLAANEKIVNEGLTAEAALEAVMQHFLQLFEQMENEYLRERGSDLKDVMDRVLAHLLGVQIPSPTWIEEEVIIIANDLTPSMTAMLNRKYIKGFVTDIGGRTSHTAIMARSLGIPAIVGTKTITDEVKADDSVIVDGEKGIAIINPDENTLASYRKKQLTFESKQTEWANLKNEQTVTLDGEKVELAANIATPEDLSTIQEFGGEAVGLFRTEFLYMGRSAFPSEEEQFEVYRAVLAQMDGKAVTIRTLDIGGDKQLSYLPLPEETNPFLGVRGIRFSLAHEDIFRTQLRALLRASVHGNLNIMFPMVATLEEFRAARTLLFEEKAALLREGIAVSPTVAVGIMVEVPSVAILANAFAKEVDFFSIGTNDLIQYIFAADRLNEHVAKLQQPNHPAVLNVVNQVIEAAHQEGKKVSICGEMAADPLAIPILLGLGLDSFSMNVRSILQARAQIRSLSRKELATYKIQLLSMTSTEEVVSFIQTYISGSN